MPTLILNNKFNSSVVRGIGGVENSVGVSADPAPLVRWITHPSQPRILTAWGTTTAAQTPAAPTKYSGNTGLTTISHKTLTFSYDSSNTTTPTVHNTNSSGTLTITAGMRVHYVGLVSATDAASKVIAYIKLANPDTNYHYEEIGTLTIPAKSYNIAFPL